MKHKRLRAALRKGWLIYCRTGNLKPYVAAFAALYGHRPVYLPQH